MSSSHRSSHRLLLLLPPYRTARLLIFGAAALVAACDRTEPLSASSRTESGTLGEPSFAQFSDVPVPAGAEMDIQRSLVLGDRDAWIGRLVIAVGLNPGRAYDFYFGEMPRFGWQPVTSVRAETSVLTYTRGGRVATIQIEGRTIAGATVSLTVSPKGAAPQPYAGSPAGSGMITTTPLR